MISRTFLCCSAAFAGLGPLAICTAAQAQGEPAQSYDLPAQDLSTALRQVAARSGRNLIVPGELVAGRRSAALSGRYTPEQAFAALLRGTGLSLRVVGGDFVIEPASKSENSAESASTEEVPASAIVVTGTKIRGAPVASPVIRLTAEQMRSAGQQTLAEAMRALPQNFGGGQNPGVGNNVPATSGVNVGSATSVNLRGLGSDATLTLVDGHRLSYSASRQAIDISAIPVPAVDRVEIVPDGASALYGSDAVAGVVNVILKRDFSGLEVDARLGTSTDGGDFEQRYSAVTGTRWGSGGVIATYEFGRTTAIQGKDRSYTAQASPALTLFPFIRSHSLVVSGHQDLGSSLTFQLDALYNNRFSTSAYALNPAGDVTLSGIRYAYHSYSLVIAPTLSLAAGGNWNVFLTGSYGRDHTRYALTSYWQHNAFLYGGNCYCNSARSLELGGDGPLARLPAGPVKLALGTGYRSNTLIRFNGAGAATNISKSQSSYYGYGELSLPLVSPQQKLPFGRRLSLSAALRYERYPHVGAIAAPKLGVIYEPGADVALKGSWGRSFRAPTLYQEYSARNVVLADPAVFGGSGFPAGSTALMLQGGNPDLKPERASSWAATVELHPHRIEGAHLELSFFDTRYRDRVVTPIGYLSQALSNPLYADRLTFNPGESLVEQVVAGADSFANVSGVPFSPGAVTVFIDDRNVNAAYQKIRGADLLADYTTQLPGHGGEIGARFNATYLDSSQQLGTGQAPVQLAGTLFNPPHWRGRAELDWHRGPFTLTGDVNYLGGITDTRAAPAARIGGMTTIDTTLLVRPAAESGPLRGLELGFTIQNLFNAKPARIATTLPSDAPYDSTNYSPVGRFIAASLRKSW